MYGSRLVLSASLFWPIDRHPVVCTRLIWLGNMVGYVVQVWVTTRHMHTHHQSEVHLPDPCVGGINAQFPVPVRVTYTVSSLYTES